MKPILAATVFLVLSSSFCAPKEWSESQLKNAGTADTVSWMNAEEKDVIRLINLARLYPADFAEIAVKNYNGEAGHKPLGNSSYKKSLLKTLKNMKPARVLLPDSSLASNTRCFANESGSLGLRGHDRRNCPPLNASECVSYGHPNARGIVLQLLIDNNVKSLGHRKICLDARYSKVAVALANHKAQEHCAVVQFK